MERKEEEWEGFEEFCEPTSRHHGTHANKETQPRISTDCNHSPSHNESPSNKTNTSPFKKNKAKQKIIDFPKKQQQPLRLHNLQSVKGSPQCEIESPSKVSVRQIRYQRIPIMRKDDDFRYAGNIVYRNFVPRSSDAYFRTLKIVDLGAPVSQHKFKSNELFQFNSRIESGNMGSVFQFHLYMRVDTNTNGHRQWFYFSVRNLLAGSVRFNIYRFKKKYSLFQRGMKPYVLSRKSGKGWQPSTGKISYRTQKYQGDNQAQNSSYYLFFEYTFEHPQDQVYFSAGIPYPLSFLNKRLTQLLSSPCQQIQAQVTTIGKTLCGQDFQLISYSPKIKKDSTNYIIINARTHPGETSSSWVLDGLMQKLFHDQAIRKWVVELNICIKIVPVLNADGVFAGNYRTGILGDDFNRKFASGRKDYFPEIFLLRKVVSDCKKAGKILLFLDLHGHSVLKNSFIYGPSESLFTSNPLRNLPFTLWHHSKYFRLSSCKFKFNKEMSETARIYFQMKENILSFTCEISLGLYYQGNQTIQMLQSDYRSLGSSILHSISQLVTKQKLHNFYTQESLYSQTQKHPQQQDRCQSKIKQIQRRQPIIPRKQSRRQTCIQKINNIKQQLIDEQNTTTTYNNINTISNISNISNNSHHNNRERDRDKDKDKDKDRDRRDFGSQENSLKKNTQKVINRGSRNQLGDTSVDGVSDKINLFKMKTTNKIVIGLRRNSIDPFSSHNFSANTSFHNSIQATIKDDSPIKAGKLDLKKQNKEAQFKIRRKSDMLRILPQSLRKKLGPKIQLGFLSTTKIQNQTNQASQEQFTLQRSATYDTPYLSSQICSLHKSSNHPVNPHNPHPPPAHPQPTLSQQQQGGSSSNLQIIDQRFSEQYHSINDSDNDSQDLTDKEKQYLIQCIKNNKKIKTTNQEEFGGDGEFQEDWKEEDGGNFNANINGFREIRFKSIQDVTRTMVPFRNTKRQAHKYRQHTHNTYKSLNRNFFEQQSLMAPQMIQKKQLNQRINKKNIRQPYTLVQIKNKHH